MLSKTVVADSCVASRTEVDLVVHLKTDCAADEELELGFLDRGDCGDGGGGEVGRLDWLGGWGWG